MSNNLNGFYSEVNNRDLSRNCLFDVSIPVPTIMFNGDFVRKDITKKLSFYCESAQLPGRSFSIATQKIYGPILKYPVLTSYDNVRLTLLCDNKEFFQRKFFDNWFDYINPSYNYNFSYKDDGYLVDIGISQYSLEGNLIYKINLIDAFPIAMSDLPLDWGDQSQHKLNVDFAYTRWEAEQVNIEELKKLPSNSWGLSDLISLGLRGIDLGYTIKGAINSGSILNGMATLASALPSFGISNITLSSLSRKI